MRSNSIMQFNVPLHWEEACYPDGWRNTRDSEQTKAKSLASISTHHRFWHIWEVSRHWSKTEMKENAVALVLGILLRMGSYTLQVWSPFRAHILSLKTVEDTAVIVVCDASSRQCGRPGLGPWVGKIPWRRKKLPTPKFWPGEFHGLCSPCGSQRVGHNWVTFTFTSLWRVSLTCSIKINVFTWWKKFKSVFNINHGLSLITLDCGGVFSFSNPGLKKYFEWVNLAAILFWKFP